MTQEKELLIKDLSMRLSYKVKVNYKYFPEHINFKFITGLRVVDNKISLSGNPNKEGDWYNIEEAGEILIKPYLRPMSSMTEEEKLALELCNAFVEPRSIELKVDFYNQQHLDYRGLIPKGLALEAPEGMYN